MEEVLFIVAGISLVVAVISILPMLTTRRRWLAAIFFLIAISCFADGVYRVETRNRTSIENVESKIRQWLDAFNVTSGKVPDDKAYFNYSASTQNSPPFSIAREKDHSGYLAIASKITLSKDDKETYEKLSEQQRTEFRMTLGAELAKAKILSIPDFSDGFALTIIKRIAITPELNESAFYLAVDDEGFGFILANNTIELLLSRLKPTPQPSSAPNKAASPH